MRTFAMFLVVTFLAGCGDGAVPPSIPDEEAPPVAPPTDPTFQLTDPLVSEGLIFGYTGCLGRFVQAAEPWPGMVVKGSAPQLFYVASNGKRYRFPTTRELASWFGQMTTEGVPMQEYDPSLCALAVEVPDEALAAMHLGGNVTLRPGTFLVGIIADSQARFLIGRGHALHRVDDAVARQLYGAPINGRMRYLPEAFFTNYLLGQAVTDPGQYDPAEERAMSTIEADGLSP